MIKTAEEAGTFIYSSYVMARKYNKEILKDEERRNPIYTRRLLDKLGAPDSKTVNILVTGSKGKGSMSKILAVILKNMGYKVGLFTGPHLVDFNERILIDDQMISDENFIRLTNKVKAEVEFIQSGLPKKEYIGPVGILAAVALLYFNEENTDINIFECGKGARYDDVAQIRGKLSVINSIFLEHKEELGETIEEIAFNKAGIIKEGQKGVFLGIQPFDQVYKIMEEEAEKNNVKIFSYAKDYKAQNIVENIDSTEFTLNNRKMAIKLCGEHQAYNAVTAISALEYFFEKEIETEVLEKAFSEIKWRGRLELVSQNPSVLLDGTINKMSAKFVVKYLKNIKTTPDIFVLSIPDDKDYKGVIDTILPLAKKIILTESHNPNLRYEQLFQVNYAKSVLEESVYIKDSYEAISLAVDEVGEKGMVCILGTISLLRDVLIFFNS